MLNSAVSSVKVYALSSTGFIVMVPLPAFMFVPYMSS